ncbi:MAG: hypothetical protein JWQ47_1042 [Glaciihabitans sp.]|nr:hypothetical protein [Glaciihabitans sp.]
MRAFNPVIAAVGVAALLLVCGCTAIGPKLSSTPTALALPTSVPAATRQLGVTTCASNAISIAFGKKLLGFASCAGIYISTNKPAHVYMSPGQTIQVKGVEENGGTISADHPDLVTANGSTITATHRGLTDIRFTNVVNGCYLSSGNQKPKQLPSEQCVAFVLVVR